MDPFTRKLLAESVQTQLDVVREMGTYLKPIAPGAALFDYVFDHDGVISQWWLLLLRINTTVDQNGLSNPKVPITTIELLSNVEAFCKNGTNETIDYPEGKPFFRFESYPNLPRAIFKKKTTEYGKIEKALDDELKQHGAVIWPYIVFILKAHKYIVLHDDYEIEKLSEHQYLITAVDPDLPGYYTVYFDFYGSKDHQFLNEFLARNSDHDVDSLNP